MIRKIARLSMTHISKFANDYIQQYIIGVDSGCDLVGYEKRMKGSVVFGYFLRVPTKQMLSTFTKSIAKWELDETTLPESLMELYEYAIDADCDWIELDAGIAPCSYLPKYDR